jgi:hypothetical protein
MYHSNYIKRHTSKSKLILVTHISCAFNKLTLQLCEISEKYTQSVICTSNDKFLNKCPVLFKVNNSNDYTLFENNELYKSELPTDYLVDTLYFKDIKDVEYKSGLIISYGTLHPAKIHTMYKSLNSEIN